MCCTSIGVAPVFRLRWIVIQWKDIPILPVWYLTWGESWTFLRQGLLLTYTGILLASSHLFQALVRRRLIPVRGHCRLHWAAAGWGWAGAGLRLSVSRPMRSQAAFYKGAIVPGASLVISLQEFLPPGEGSCKMVLRWNHRTQTTAVSLTLHTQALASSSRGGGAEGRTDHLSQQRWCWACPLQRPEVA